MHPFPDAACRERSRHLLFLSRPELWPVWPYLPLIRRQPGAGEDECGLLFDIFHLDGRTGLSASVFLTNLFTMPQTFEEFLALPREQYDSPEEVYAAGWRVD
jgi:hypothetical protein